jgi:hypothetical protein
MHQEAINGSVPRSKTRNIFVEMNVTLWRTALRHS